MCRSHCLGCSACDERHKNLNIKDLRRQVSPGDQRARGPLGKKWSSGPTNQTGKLVLTLFCAGLECFPVEGPVLFSQRLIEGNVSMPGALDDRILVLDLELVEQRVKLLIAFNKPSLAPTTIRTAILPRIAAAFFSARKAGLSSRPPRSTKAPARMLAAANSSGYLKPKRAAPLPPMEKPSTMRPSRRATVR